MFDFIPQEYEKLVNIIFFGSYSFNCKTWNNLQKGRW